MEKKLFFGWINIKWLIREIVNMYSNIPSFFSQKRVRSGIAFVVAEWGAIFFLINKYAVMTTSDFTLWISPQLVIAGYVLYQIQKEKKDLNQLDPAAEVEAVVPSVIPSSVTSAIASVIPSAKPDPITEPPIPDPPGV